jgi:hypothetical protein
MGSCDTLLLAALVVVVLLIISQYNSESTAATYGGSCLSRSQPQWPSQQWQSQPQWPQQQQDGFRNGMPRSQFQRVSEVENDQWHGAIAADAEGPDYSGYLTDLVTDPRTRETHQQWVEEMKPWSGTAITIDDMDEAMEASTDFIGLRRPQAAPQYNPYFVTEKDPNTFGKNPRFAFQG